MMILKMTTKINNKKVKKRKGVADKKTITISFYFKYLLILY